MAKSRKSKPISNVRRPCGKEARPRLREPPPRLDTPADPAPEESTRLEEMVEARTREVQESERRYRSLAENAPDVIQRFDRELRHLYVNPAFEQATGLAPPAVIGRTDRELRLSEDLVPFWEQAAHTVFETGKDQVIDFEMLTPQGPRHYEAHLVPEFTSDGATEYVLAITRDITERTRMEEALRFTQSEPPA